MKIPFEDPIWDLMFGPYGVEEVPSILRSLKDRWDQPLADNLYWEKLHHQESLYPVTYAALPWLWAMAPKDLTNLCFFSWIIRCATYRLHWDGSMAVAGKYHGLPHHSDTEDTAFLLQSVTLIERHQEQMVGLVNWCDTSFPEIANRCQSALAECRSPHDLHYLLVGPMTFDGAQDVANVFGMWCDGHELQDIADELEPWTEADVRMATKWAAIFEQRAPNCGAILREYARLMDPERLVERCSKTPDMFG